jgi:hypothetical protein
VIAAPNGGHSFVHWTENGRVVSTSESYTFTLNGNYRFCALYDKISREDILAHAYAQCRSGAPGVDSPLGR